MTDAALPPDDEIVSAVLDGEATDDERARVEADPAARRRLAELADLRRHLAAPVAVPDDAREQALAAALAAYDQQRLGDTTGSTPGVTAATSAATSAAGLDPVPSAPDELAVRRARRSGRGARALAAAAAIVVVIIGIGALVRSTGQQTEVASTGVATTQEQGPPAAENGGVVADDDAGAPDPASGPTTTMTQPVPAPSTPPTTTPGDAAGAEAFDRATIDLGVVSSPGELRTLMVRTLDEQTAAERSATTTSLADGPSLATAGFDSCAAVVRAADPEIGPVLAAATATYQGRPALIFAFGIDRVSHPAANGSVRIYAVAADGCSTLSVQTVR